MRWDDLFGDLEGQLAAAEAAETEAEVADRTRREAALVPLSARLRSGLGRRVALRLSDGSALGEGQAAAVLEGVLTETGADWLLLVEDSGHELVARVEALLTVDGLPAGPSAQDPGPSRVAARLGLGVLLRALARDRRAVEVALRGGGRVTGTVERVGADHLELTRHDLGEVRPRRGGDVALVPFPAVAWIRSRR